MKSKSVYSLQRTMILYFLLIGFASLLVGVEFVMDTHKAELKDALFANFDKYSKGEIPHDDIFAPLYKLRNKAILMMVIILFVMIIVLTMFIKNITEPLQHMIEISQEISGGDLSHTVVIHANNELAQLGNVINEMSSNLQEIILLSKNMCSSGRNFTETASAILDQETVTPEHLERLKAEIHHLKTELITLSEVIAYFNVYTVEKET